MIARHNLEHFERIQEGIFMRRWCSCWCVSELKRSKCSAREDELLAAYRVFVEPGSPVPAADIKSIQTLYYIYAKRHHPDAGDTGCEVMMQRGNEAYALLKAATSTERQSVVNRLLPTTRAEEAPKVSSAFWEHRDATFDEKEFIEFLSSLEGTDKLRFHRSWTSPDGTRYRGIDERKGFSTPVMTSTCSRFDEMHFRSNKTMDNSTRVVVLFVICCTFLVYFVTVNVITRRLIEKMH